ncbi:MAG: hypothetical protein MUO40_00535 [Anaerolineaceae bacterium]|nr:hypothetical protein [Anaerolineaceae bacterium]
MKKAISISIGSSIRDKETTINLLGEEVNISRVGTDGDMGKAALMYKELDGKVDAFGVGGTDLGLYVDKKWYPLYSVQSLVKDVKITPVVDGLGLKTTLEVGAAKALEEEISEYLDDIGRTVLVMTAVDRFGLVRSFSEAGYQCTYGDMMFSLGVHVPLHSVKAVKMMAATLIPIVSRVPFEWVYPVGESQNKRTPKYEKEFQKVSVIAGDCHYITRYMPDKLEGKVIVTNTTTPRDVELFTSAGVAYLLTTTPVLDGRSFGTNMMEAAIVAASGRTEPVDYRHAEEYFDQLSNLIKEIGLKPQLRKLN